MWLARQASGNRVPRSGAHEPARMVEAPEKKVRRYYCGEHT